MAFSLDRLDKIITPTDDNEVAEVHIGEEAIGEESLSTGAEGAAEQESTAGEVAAATEQEVTTPEESGPTEQATATITAQPETASVEQTTATETTLPENVPTEQVAATVTPEELPATAPPPTVEEAVSTAQETVVAAAPTNAPIEGAADQPAEDQKTQEGASPEQQATETTISTLAANNTQTPESASTEAVAGAAAGYDPALVEQGQTLFLVCSACHGPDAHGLPGLGKDLIASEFVGSLSDEELLTFIVTGRPVWDPANTSGVDMPPKGGNPALTNDDIQAIIAYVRTLRQQAAP